MGRANLFPMQMQLPARVFGLNTNISSLTLDHNKMSLGWLIYQTKMQSYQMRNFSDSAIYDPWFIEQDFGTFLPPHTAENSIGFGVSTIKSSNSFVLLSYISSRCCPNIPYIYIYIYTQSPQTNENLPSPLLIIISSSPDFKFL